MVQVSPPVSLPPVLVYKTELDLENYVWPGLDTHFLNYVWPGFQEEIVVARGRTTHLTTLGTCVDGLSCGRTTRGCTKMAAPWPHYEGLYKMVAPWPLLTVACLPVRTNRFNRVLAEKGGSLATLTDGAGSVHQPVRHPKIVSQPCILGAVLGIFRCRRTTFAHLIYIVHIVHIVHIAPSIPTAGRGAPGVSTLLASGPSEQTLVSGRQP